MMDRVVTTNEIDNELEAILAKLVLLMKRTGEQKPDNLLEVKVLLEVYDRVVKAIELLKPARDLLNGSYYHHPIFLE